MMAAEDLPWKPIAEGILVRVRLTPKASRDCIEGVEATAEGAAIKARVRAIPADGEANAAVAALFAKWLGVPKSSVALVAGGKSRVKSLAVRGEPDALAREVAAKLGQ
ncbi:MAG: DUF167 family protein [Hyphomicrobiaceae bacterium]